MIGSPLLRSQAVDRDSDAAGWYVRHESEDGILAGDWREWVEWGAKPGNAAKYAEFHKLNQLVASLPRPALPSAEEILADVVPETAIGPLRMIAGNGRRNLWTLQGRMTAVCCGCLVLLGALGGWFLGHHEIPSSTAAMTPEINEGAPFSDAALERMRAEGHPVFVNLRASWCPTCTANERTVLARNSVQQMMSRKHVVYLTGDWSLQDPMISAELRRFGSNGVPLYLLFSPGSKEPMILPQVLTEHVVLRELARLPDPQASS